jgi:hypothetical protein
MEVRILDKHARREPIRGWKKKLFWQSASKPFNYYTNLDQVPIEVSNIQFDI